MMPLLREGVPEATFSRTLLAFPYIAYGKR